jgi:hypothetical protein
VHSFWSHRRAWSARSHLEEIQGSLGILIGWNRTRASQTFIESWSKRKKEQNEGLIIATRRYEGPSTFSLDFRNENNIIFFPSKNHSSRAFLDLLDSQNYCILHFTFHLHLQWHMNEVSLEFQSLVSPFQIQTLFYDVIWLPRAPPYGFSLRYDNTRWSYVL